MRVHRQGSFTQTQRVKDTADLITDIAELQSRSDGWIRVALPEALVFAGVVLHECRMAAILEPVLAEFRAHGI